MDYEGPSVIYLDSLSWSVQGKNGKKFASFFDGVCVYGSGRFAGCVGKVNSARKKARDCSQQPVKDLGDI